MKNNYLRLIIQSLTVLVFTFCISQDLFSNNSFAIEGGSECVASFGYEIKSSEPGDTTLLSFYDYSSGNIASWFWDFGDGNTSAEQYPTHFYIDDGTYEVCLTVVSEDTLCYGSYCTTITIENGPDGSECAASFDYEDGDSTVLYFYDYSSGNIASWFWDFGDGNTSTQQNPSHLYMVDGTYEVCLTVVSEDTLCYDNYCTTITLENGSGGSECVASFDYEGWDSALYFYDYSSGIIDSWFWDFGDGNTSTEQNPVHYYEDDGAYEVCLTIMGVDSSLCFDIYCSIIIIENNTDCASYFGYEISFGDTPESSFVNFFDLSLGDIASWSWDFGDGTFSNEQNPVHQYEDDGIYEVCLTISSDDSLCEHTYCNIVTIIDTITEFYILGGIIFVDTLQMEEGIPIDKGISYAYQLDGGQIVSTYSGFMADYGYFDFYMIPATSYKIKAEVSPDSYYAGQYIPTYYGNVPNWSDAVILDVQGNVWNADIKLIPITDIEDGNGSIEGIVTYSNDKSKAESIEVLLINSNDLVVGIDYTNENGVYKFENLPVDSYVVMVDIAGKESIPAEVVINNDNLEVEDLNFIVNSESVIILEKAGHPEFIAHIGEVFPNPAVHTATINYSLTQSSYVNVVIYTITGQVMYSEMLKASPGVNEIKLNTSELPGGMYYLDIKFDSRFKQTKKFIKID